MTLGQFRRMRVRAVGISLAVLAAMLIVPSAAPATAASTPITLTFGSLPSAQGWTYFQSDGIPETSVYSVTGTSLIQDTIGIGEHAPNYAMFGVVDGSKPFQLTVRARILSYEGTAPFGFHFEVRTAAPNQDYAIGLSPSRVADASGNGIAIDTTIFHTYVLRATPGGPYTLDIDGQFALAGTFVSNGGALNAVQIGDGANLGPTNARAEVTQLEFSQDQVSAFTVQGGIPVPTISSNPPNTSQSTHDQFQTTTCNTGRLNAYRRLAQVVIVPSMLAAGAPDAADLLLHFLDGTGSTTLGNTGASTNYPDGSTPSLEMQQNANFMAMNDYIKAEIASVLGGGDDNVDLSSFLQGLDGLRPNTAPPLLDSPVDLNLAFRGTQGVSVTGQGTVDRTTGEYSGQLDIVVSDSYGFSEADTRTVPFGFGKQMRYLQTVCGFPPNVGGAHWFPDSIEVIEPFSGTL